MAQWVDNISDWELLARTLQAEAGNQGPEGMIAVGSVIMNRAGNDPRKIRDVILKRGQFSAWNSLTGYAGGEQGQDMENMQPSDIAFTIAANLINDKYNDPTGGATHYYNPTISSPAWGQAKAGGEWQQIGDHLFGNADAKRSGESPKNPPAVRISTNNPNMTPQGSISEVGSAPNMQPKSPLLQSIMNESGYPNMGMPQIAGYSVPAQAPQAAPKQPTLPSGNNAPRGGFGRIMDFLGDARTAQTLSKLSNTEFGRKMGEIATARLGMQKGNETAKWLRTQPQGETYARMIEAGMPAQEALEKFEQDTGIPAGQNNVQSSIPLPNLAGRIVTLRTGETFVMTSGGEKLLGEEADEYIKLAQDGELSYQERLNAAKEKGRQDVKLTFAKRMEKAKAEGKELITWASEVRKKRDNILATIRGYEAALQALDNKAESGRVAKLIPTTTAQTQLLESARQQLGLAVIGSVTFGALSEGELQLALDTALPSDKLNPEQLRAWINERLEPAKKLEVALLQTADYLAGDGASIQGYYREFLGIDPNTVQTGSNTGASPTSTVDSVPAPTVTPSANDPAGIRDLINQ